MIFIDFDEIKQALGIPGTLTNTFAWSMNQAEENFGVQIDLAIDRQDQTINGDKMKQGSQRP